MKKVIVFISLFLHLISVNAIEYFEPETNFNEANEFYKNQEYDKALALYKDLIDQNYQSAELFYNAGNAAFNLKQVAPSILYYEKALKLQPDDEDIIHNLQLANLKVVDKIDQVQDFFVKVWYRSLVTSNHPDEWSRIGITSLFLALVLMILYLVHGSILVKKIGFFGALILILFSVSSISMAFSGKSILENRQHAIIFSGRVTIKASPNTGSKDLFVIHEGTKVTILEENDNWLRIRIADGNDGWITKEHLEVI
jgi:tetratricopeptide (TPR) repeat protein